MGSIANKSMVGVTICAVIAQVVYWYGQLPDPMPSHFNAAGQVDDEMGKFSFFAMMLGIHVLFLIGFPLIGSLLRRMPDSLINMPNKDYWLAPERREATLAKTAGIMTMMGWMTSWLMMGITHLTAMVAVDARQTINPESNWLLGIFLVAVFVVVVKLLFSYRLPKVEGELQT